LAGNWRAGRTGFSGQARRRIALRMLNVEGLFGCCISSRLRYRRDEEQQNLVRPQRHFAATIRLQTKSAYPQQSTTKRRDCPPRTYSRDLRVSPSMLKRTARQLLRGPASEAVPFSGQVDRIDGSRASSVAIVAFRLSRRAANVLARMEHCGSVYPRIRECSFSAATS
jgi:hypothetical protein